MTKVERSTKDPTNYRITYDGNVYYCVEESHAKIYYKSNGEIVNSHDASLIKMLSFAISDFLREERAKEFRSMFEDKQ